MKTIATLLLASCCLSIVALPYDKQYDPINICCEVSSMCCKVYENEICTEREPNVCASLPATGFPTLDTPTPTFGFYVNPYTRGEDTPVVRIFSKYIQGSEHNIRLEHGEADFGRDLVYDPLPNGPPFWLFGNLTYAEPINACSALTNSFVMDGKIAVINRGDCTFLQKAIHAEAAGAIGVIIVFTQQAQPEAMTYAYNEDPSQVSISVVSVGKFSGETIQGALAHNHPVECGIGLEAFVYAGKYIYEFGVASHGPTLLDMSPALVSAPVVYASPKNACSKLENEAQMYGTIAVVDRGECYFHQKSRLCRTPGLLAL